MILPRKVLNRLRLGREVAARAPESAPGRSAWVYVYPMVNSETGRVLYGDGQEERIVALGDENPIAGFLVRYVELENNVVEEFQEWRRDESSPPALERREWASDEEALMEILSSWSTAALDFHVPDLVGYIFDLGPDLLHGTRYDSPWRRKHGWYDTQHKRPEPEQRR